jgi:hypothetical protein
VALSQGNARSIDCVHLLLGSAVTRHGNLTATWTSKGAQQHQYSNAAALT